MTPKEGWTAEVFSHPDEIKDAEYRYWPPHERMAAIFDFMVTGYAWEKRATDSSRFGGVVEVTQR